MDVAVEDEVVDVVGVVAVDALYMYDMRLMQLLK